MYRCTGFDAAVNTAIQTVDKVRDTSTPMKDAVLLRLWAGMGFIALGGIANGARIS